MRGETEYDHQPALVFRPYDEAKADFTPAGNDPEFIRAVHADCHLAKTAGKTGEKTATTIGSDIGEAARLKRLEAKYKDFRERLLKKEQVSAVPGHRTRWPKRKLRWRTNTRKST